VLVDWIDNKDGQVFVGSGTNRVSVRTVHSAGVNPYLQTQADGSVTNNLLSLPTF
jgi:hypothetical protein